MGCPSSRRRHALSMPAPTTVWDCTTAPGVTAHSHSAPHDGDAHHLHFSCTISPPLSSSPASSSAEVDPSIRIASGVIENGQVVIHVQDAGPAAAGGAESGDRSRTASVVDGHTVPVVVRHITTGCYRVSFTVRSLCKGHRARRGSVITCLGAGCPVIHVVRPIDDLALLLPRMLLWWCCWDSVRPGSVLGYIHPSTACLFPHPMRPPTNPPAHHCLVPCAGASSVRWRH